MQFPAQNLAQLLVGVLVTTLAGCGGNTRAVYEGHTPLSDQFQNLPNPIVVVPNDFEQPLSSLLSRRSEAGGGAAAGAAKGAAGSIIVGCGTGTKLGPFGLILGCAVGVLVAPVVMVGGAIAGADSADVHWSTHDITSLDEASELLESGLKDVRPELAISREVVSWLRSRVDNEVSLQSFRGPVEGMILDKPLAGLVEIRLTRFGIVIHGNFDQGDEDPSISLLMRVTAITYLGSEEKLVHKHTGDWEYMGSSRKYSKVRADPERFLEKEINAAASVIARLIVE